MNTGEPFCTNSELNTTSGSFWNKTKVSSQSGKSKNLKKTEIFSLRVWPKFLLLPHEEPNLVFSQNLPEAVLASELVENGSPVFSETQEASYERFRGFAGPTKLAEISVISSRSHPVPEASKFLRVPPLPWASVESQECVWRPHKASKWNPEVF